MMGRECTHFGHGHCLGQQKAVIALWEELRHLPDNRISRRSSSQSLAADFSVLGIHDSLAYFISLTSSVDSLINVLKSFGNGPYV
jgi:hypothetical protein